MSDGQRADPSAYVPVKRLYTYPQESSTSVYAILAIIVRKELAKTTGGPSRLTKADDGAKSQR